MRLTRENIFFAKEQSYILRKLQCCSSKIVMVSFLFQRKMSSLFCDCKLLFQTYKSSNIGLGLIFDSVMVFVYSSRLIPYVFPSVLIYPKWLNLPLLIFFSSIKGMRRLRFGLTKLAHIIIHKKHITIIASRFAAKLKIAFTNGVVLVRSLVEMNSSTAR